ncbi:MAG: hypothetical protein LBS50_04985 [Prevotellaceae bacterium]|jgi:hypothetical protein|nr:hypothetical protein [Prevotellaceae bacterium]
MKKFVFVLFFFCAINLQAQVTIGDNVEPSKYSLLDLVTTQQKRGLHMPRIHEAERNALIVNAADTVAARGLFIYNIDTDCEEFWNGSEWKSLCGSAGKAVIKVECSTSIVDIVVGAYKRYFNGRDLTPEHYLDVTVQVIEKGIYNLIAVPNPSNGYYFQANGEFLETGTFIVRMQGMGKPINFSVPESDLTVGDQIVLKNFDEELCDRTVIHINNGAEPKFEMNCGTAKSAGIYKVRTELDTTNIITITVNVTNVNLGAVVLCETDVVNGIQFVSNPTPILATGKISITLYGKGKPNAAGSYKFTIKSNSTTSTVVCEVTVQVVMRPKKILVYGTASGYGYNFAGANAANAADNGGTYEFVRDTRNFGTLPESVVPIEMLTLINGSNSNLNINDLNGVHGSAPNYSAATQKLAEYLSKNNPDRPDIIYIAYNAGWLNYKDNKNRTVGQILADYCKEGNLLILFGDNNASGELAPGMGTSNVASSLWTQFMQALFGRTGIQIRNWQDDPAGAMSTSLTGRCFMFSNINHPALNGPFGDIRGKYWGEDASYPQVATGLNVNDLYLISDSYDWSEGRDRTTSGYTIFASKDYPFIFIGDGGFMSHDGTPKSAIDTWRTICPFKLDATHFPKPKPDYGGGANRFAVYNSIFFANVITWGLKLVEGIKD